MGSTTYDDAAQKELEDELVKAGRRLHSLPSSIDEILIHLEKAESVLARVWQLPPSSTEDALYPVMKGLISDKLLRHADENVQFVVASCFSELTRITAPKFPYNDDDMREIFKLFLVALRPLSSESGSNYLRAVQILEGLATVRSNPSSNIVNYMETIMRMVIEEIDEVSLDLLRPLLASVRMDNKKPITPSVDYGEELVNLRIMVWWPIDKTFYTGTVEAFDPLTKKHRIKYDDDEEEVLNLKKERWELFSEKQPRKIQSYQKQEADDHNPSPAEEPVKIQKKMTKRKPGSSRKQHAPTSSIRPKGEGHGLAKSGDSSPNLEFDDKMCEANFSSKDNGENNRVSKKRRDNLNQHKKTKPTTPLPEML
ncbi:UNVERIFIED_CONTAM: hypothetical protein Sangu_0099100 [Sesamum angustifolium]|uniref:Uncharacterized protein n=1 Tax=Sesamum angustifolium TaxID=2727405 RepID=A0AAW2RKG8_9LAMI